jgi:hypothetical protein
MSRVPDNVIEALRGSHQLGVFMRLDTDPPRRVWLGINDIPGRIDGIDPETDEVYIGGGVLREVPNLEACINGIADRAEFQISGIDPVSAAQQDVEAFSAAARGKDFHVGITTLDDKYQPMSTIIPLMTGRASFAAESMPVVQGTDNPTVSMALSVGFGITTRDRQSQVLWSAPHHRAIYPDDAFCDGTTRLERGVAPDWPRF